MTIELIRLHRLSIPLVRPFRTSFGTESVRDVILVEAVTGDGVHGWGECVTMSWPGYSYEYGNSAIAVIGEHLLPSLRELDADAGPEDVRAALDVVRGHPMAKCALSTALLDAWLRGRGRSLADYLGAQRDRVDCGVSVGIPTTESIVELLDEVGQYVDAGYRRIKLKIEPGWDLEPVSAVRSAWPDIPLQTDANQAYQRSDAQYLARLDEFDLLLHEQPLPEDDWYGHVLMSQACRTPICMDESIHSAASADSALTFGAASIINIKPGRVGGYLTARDIHDLCRDRDAPVWCGGMLETGIGRAANVALAALPGFTLPGDTSASSRYYEVDVTPPFVLEDGQLAVPTGPGIGVDPIPEVLADLTVWSTELRPE
ncbi:MAG: o-succinylbenzoate synthase [Actinomycetota bacterium]|nr:o-succinylbenzoate synthase [Actinomycetota bacterium]